MTDTLTDDEQLAAAIAEFYADPLGYVLFCWPWGEDGTALAHEDGPDTWQRTFLQRLGEEVRARGFDGTTAVDAIQMAAVSGHGSGKSALTSWLIKWIMDTRPNCKGTVTASTNTQLETKTWPELAKWHKLSLTRHWCEMTMGRGSMKIVNVSNPDGWRCTAQTASKENSEAFAGQHAADSTSFYIFDESSGVPDEISNVAEGGLTDGEPMWFQFGNGTKNTGKFHRIFHKERHRWIGYHVDSRTCKKTNKAQHAKWIEDYGEDSDFVRVRVRGLFPNQSADQWIATAVAEAAAKREIAEDMGQRMVLGVDVARQGGDMSVICRRRGRDARSWPWYAAQTNDTMHLVGKVMEIYNQHVALRDEPIVMVDGTGMGGPIIDRLRQLGVDVIEVQFGAASRSPLCHNHRTEIWHTMREWLQSGGAIPNMQELIDDLTGIEYGYSQRDGQKWLLESKDSMKARGLASPDHGDALAITFSVPVAPKGYADQQGMGHRTRTEYAVLE